MPPRFDDRSLDALRAILAARPAIEIDEPRFRRACVLVPLVRNGAGWSLLFSRRAENLQAHSGQIAFPGGAVEEGESLIDAAAREAEEEVGIPREKVELIGRLDDLITNSGYLVAPFVGVIDERIDYVLQASEVAEVFEVPVESLLAEGNPEVRYVPFGSRSYPAYFYHHGPYEIWGLTGRMVKTFLDVVWLTVELTV